MDYKPRNAFRESYEDAKRYKKERHRIEILKSIKILIRLILAFVVLAIAINVISYFVKSEPLISRLFPIVSGGGYWYILLPIVVVFVAVVIGILSENNNKLRINGVSIERFQNFNHRLDSLQKTVDLCRENQRALENNSVNALDDEDKKELYDTIYAKIKNETSEDALRELENIVRANTILNDVKEYFSEMEGRLFQRAGSLNTTSFINLFIGITIAIIGISILLYFVFNTDYEYAQNNVLLLEMLAKLGVSVGVEFLSFFFLNLYRKNLQEIKYIQNEITNIEAKKVALLMANELPVKYKFKVINALSLTERNFILDKGQTTVELETLKYEQKEIYKMLKHAGGLVRVTKDK